jgi:hypothetical protein
VYNTKAEFIDALTGTWLLCEAPSVFRTNEAGLSINSDGSWAKLQENADGSLSPMAGWDNFGRWEVIDTGAMNGSGSYQVNFHRSSGGAYGMRAAFATNVLKMRLDNSGYYQSDYVAL